MALNEEIYKALSNYGGKVINERVFNYLGSLGYTGTLSDRLAKYQFENKKGWQALVARYAGRWTPAQLFSSGEQGVWYEPKPQYLFQDAAGTVPVTADGDPVGLMLDLHKGLTLGPEANPDPDLLNGTGWTLGTGWGMSDGQLVANSAPGGARAYFSEAGAADKTYLIKFNIDVTEGSATLYTNPTMGIGGGVGQSFELRVKGSSVGRVFDLRASNTFSCVITNLSVRELLGNHATQSTSAARPLYPGLAHDGVDDTLIAPNASLPDLTTVYARVKRTGPDKGIIFGGNDAFALVYQSDSSTSLPNATEIDGQVVNTRAQAFDAMTENTWVLVKVLNVDTSFTDFTDIQTVGYRGNSDTNFHSQCEVGALIAVSATSASENDAEIIGYLEASA